MATPQCWAKDPETGAKCRLKYDHNFKGTIENGFQVEHRGYKRKKAIGLIGGKVHFQAPVKGQLSEYVKIPVAWVGASMRGSKRWDYVTRQVKKRERWISWQKKQAERNMERFIKTNPLAAKTLGMDKLEAERLERLKEGRKSAGALPKEQSSRVRPGGGVTADRIPSDEEGFF